MKCSCGGKLKIYKKKVRREAYPVSCMDVTLTILTCGVWAFIKFIWVMLFDNTVEQNDYAICSKCGKKYTYVNDNIPDPDDYDDFLDYYEDSANAEYNYNEEGEWIGQLVKQFNKFINQHICHYFLKN